MLSGASYRLDTLGTLSLKEPGGAIRASDQRQQRRRLALLASLACAGERGVSRDQLLLLFWPESTEKKARHSLDQLLYAIRTSLNDSVFAGVNPIRLNGEIVSSDVADFNRELDAGNLVAATRAYGGPLLAGFYLSEAREFDDWVERERERLSHRYRDALEKLALEAEQSSQHDEAITWRRKLSEADPVSTRYAVGLMGALAKSGDHAAAISQGEHYQRIAARELGNGRVAAVDELIQAIREQPARIPHSISIGPERQETANVVLAKTRGPRRFLAGSLVAALAGAAVWFAAAAVHPQPRATVSQAPTGTKNVAAYEFYKRGMDPVMLRDDSTSFLALNYLGQAIKLDTMFAAAYAGEATIYQRLAMSNGQRLPLGELKTRAINAAQKSILLDDSLAEGYAVLGLIESFWGTDLVSSEKNLKRAIELNPRDTKAREYLAITLLLLGRPNDALQQTLLAERSDPLSPTAKASTAQVLYVMGRCAEAMQVLDSLAALRPPLLRAAVTRSLCYAQLGRYADALALLRTHSGDHDDSLSSGLFGFALANNGERVKASRIHERLVQMENKEPSVGFSAAMVSFALGNQSDAVAEINRAAGSTALPYELLGPPFADLMSDRRIRAAARVSPPSLRAMNQSP